MIDATPTVSALSNAITTAQAVITAAELTDANTVLATLVSANDTYLAAWPAVVSARIPWRASYETPFRLLDRHARFVSSSFERVTSAPIAFGDDEATHATLVERANSARARVGASSQAAQATALAAY